MLSSAINVFLSATTTNRQKLTTMQRGVSAIAELLVSVDMTMIVCDRLTGMQFACYRAANEQLLIALNLRRLVGTV